MLTRCPGCAKEVDESAEVCPHCNRDFSVPVVRKRPQATPPSEKPAGPRPRRPAEREGIDYHFLSEEEFQTRERLGEFLETVRLFNHHYGTLKSEVDRVDKKADRVGWLNGGIAAALSSVAAWLGTRY